MVMPARHLIDKDMMIQEQNINVNALSVIEGLNLDKVQKSMAKIHEFQKMVQETLVEGHDYGASFYGASKPSLLKPGAEKILMLLGLSTQYEIIEKIQDYEEGFFAYTVRCVITKNGQLITQGFGHCNSKEKKYTSDKQDLYMLGNTCLKMAKKRAQVDATLTVASLSDIFTQDLEDMAQFSQRERMETMTTNDALNTKVTFGKHRGRTLGQLLEEDKSYVEWLAENARDESMRKACKLILNEPVQEQKSSEDIPEPDQKTENEELQCESCGCSVTGAVRAYSQRYFGKTLCKDCQKKISPASDKQIKAIYTIGDELGTDKDGVKDLVSEYLQKDIESLNELTKDEASKIIEYLQGQLSELPF